MKSNYKPIGKHIRLVDERNKGWRVQQLLGLSISKQFIPSVANIIGTDMENYKIIRKNQFACSTMQVRRDKKMPVALLKDLNEAIISQAYPIFEVKDEKELLPEYLMMWFERSEFDREACFHAIGGVRGSLEWEDFENMLLPIPHIDKQQEIVKEYNTIQNCIALNQQFIQKLEETAQAIYREWFVEGVDLENLPEGWLKSKIGDEVETLGGGTPSTEIEDYWKEGEIFWYSPTDITNNNSVFIFQSSTKITKAGLNKSSAKLFPANCLMMTSRATVGKLAINTEEATTNQGFITLIPNSKLNVYFLYCWINTQIEEIIKLASGSTFLEISKSDFRNLEIVVPENEINEKFKKTIEPIFELIKIKTKENQKLTELKELFLSKLATIETNN
jgi:type I restriction enzyme S subunit